MNEGVAARSAKEMGPIGGEVPGVIWEAVTEAKSPALTPFWVHFQNFSIFQRNVANWSCGFKCIVQAIFISSPEEIVAGCEKACTIYSWSCSGVQRAGCFMYIDFFNSIDLRLHICRRAIATCQA